MKINDCFKIIASNVKKLRMQHGLTQKEMADLLGNNYDYYATLERGKDINRNFTLEKIMVICKLFNVTPNDIIIDLPEEITPIENNSERLKDELISKIMNCNIEELRKIKRRMKDE